MGYLILLETLLIKKFAVYSPYDSNNMMPFTDMAKAREQADEIEAAENCKIPKAIF